MNYIIDCGFSMGCFSHRRLKALERQGEDLTNWTVHGFEPDNRWVLDPRMEHILSWQGPTINIHSAAVWTEDGRMRFYPCKSRSSSYLQGAVHKYLESGRNTSYEVDTVDLDRFIKELPDRERVILKMDIEGGEFYVLPHIQANGSALLLEEVRIEYHARMNRKQWVPILKEVKEWWAAHPQILHGHRR